MWDPSVMTNHRLWDERGSLFRGKNFPRDKYPFGRHFALPSSFSFLARSFKLRMSRTNFSGIGLKGVISCHELFLVEFNMK